MPPDGTVRTWIACASLRRLSAGVLCDHQSPQPADRHQPMAILLSMRARTGSGKVHARSGASGLCARVSSERPRGSCGKGRKMTVFRPPNGRHGTASAMGAGQRDRSRICKASNTPRRRSPDPRLAPLPASMNVSMRSTVPEASPVAHRVLDDGRGCVADADPALAQAVGIGRDPAFPPIRMAHRHASTPLQRARRRKPRHRHTQPEITPSAVSRR